jgi:hypothetical protein
VIIPRDRYAQLLIQRGDLTLAEALEQLQVPQALWLRDLELEDYLIIGHRLMWRGGRSAAAAGFNSNVALYNTSQGPVIPVVVIPEYCLISAEATSIGVVVTALDGANGAPLTFVSLGDGFPRDRSIGGDSNGTIAGGGEIFTKNDAAANPGTVIGNTALAINSSVRLDLKGVLNGNRGINIGSTVVNTTIEVIYWWREFELRIR